MSVHQFVVAEPPKRKANASAGQGSSKRSRPNKTFWEACVDGNLEAVQWYIKEGINVNQVDNRGFTPLYIACAWGHLDVVNALLSTDGIDVNKANRYRATPLYIACQHGHLEVVNALLRQDGININLARYGGSTPLYVACRNGHSDVVNALLRQDGIDINRAESEYGRTPLYTACLNGHLEVVKALLRFRSAEGQSTDGINVNQANKYGQTPLFIACSEGHLEVVNALLARPEIDVNQANRYGETAFQVATAACKEALIRWRERKMAEEIGRHRNLPEAIVTHGIHPFLNHGVKTKLKF